jgi:hypothetical protein
MRLHPRSVVLLTLLALPLPLFGQVRELSQPGPAPQPVTLTAPQETEASTNDCCGGCLWSPCCASDCQPLQSVFLFGGQFTKGSMGNTADIFNVEYDDNYIAGLGYQRFPWTLRRFYFGWEIGVAGRFGDLTSAEIWGGPAIRHRGMTFSDLLTVTPSLTAGFSAVTESHGFERHREIGRDGDATFLFYLGPEIALTTRAFPNTEFFYRLHHRCGANGTLGDLSEGYNANIVGVRFKF